MGRYQVLYMMAINSKILFMMVIGMATHENLLVPPSQMKAMTPCKCLVYNQVTLKR